LSAWTGMEENRVPKPQDQTMSQGTNTKRQEKRARWSLTMPHLWSETDKARKLAIKHKYWKAQTRNMSNTTHLKIELNKLPPPFVRLRHKSILACLLQLQWRRRRKPEDAEEERRRRWKCRGRRPPSLLPPFPPVTTSLCCLHKRTVLDSSSMGTRYSSKTVASDSHNVSICVLLR